MLIDNITDWFRKTPRKAVLKDFLLKFKTNLDDKPVKALNKRQQRRAEEKAKRADQKRRYEESMRNSRLWLGSVGIKD